MINRIDNSMSVKVRKVALKMYDRHAYVSLFSSFFGSVLIRMITIPYTLTLACIYIYIDKAVKR